LEKKNVLAKKCDEIRRLDGTFKLVRISIDHDSFFAVMTLAGKSASALAVYGQSREIKLLFHKHKLYYFIEHSVVLNFSFNFLRIGIKQRRILRWFQIRWKNIKKLSSPPPPKKKEEEVIFKNFWQTLIEVGKRQPLHFPKKYISSSLCTLGQDYQKIITILIQIKLQ
jgi:hypothetical protein